jgi:hypothetical protein
MRPAGRAQRLVEKIFHRVVMVIFCHTVGLHAFCSNLIVPLHIVFPLPFISLLFLPCRLLQETKNHSQHVQRTINKL